ncbi:MAG TPA: glycosyltransferase family 2 protein [Candidatus Omnitrophota bacterium]|nr:glycosyltransferase family 2 protein [Candidatus Omnitrophota bacterium]HPS19563.1 glycosyltransferase family 2 protein [Candidatus Omnitrophota bacterium]
MVADGKFPLSVVIITKNEEKRIKDCIESVKWAAEIIVLDDFSRDRTVDIAKELGAKVYQKQWTNEGAHRNYAYSLATNDWILSLDADERVTPELKEEIVSTLQNGTDCNGFAIPRKNFIGTYWLQYGGWYPSAQLRLFRRGEFKYEEVDVHPRAFMKDPRGNLKNPMLHYSYRDLEDFVAKTDNMTSRECAKWIETKAEMPFGRALRRSLDRFFRAYGRKQGKKDGMYGYIVAILGGFYQFLSYAKYWERKLGAAYPYDNKLKEPFEKIGAKDCDKERKKLSVVILTKNEEDKIAHCLATLTWADEVVLVDGFSTDLTAEIAEKFGAKVVPHKFEGDFGLERNIGIENSSGDWVLQLDADEMMTAGFKKRILSILKKDEGYVAYKFIRKNSFLGRFMRYGGWYHYSHHFFKKGFAHYDGRVHHQLIVDGKLGVIKDELEHYPFQSIAQLVSRQNRYTTIEARELMELRGTVSDKEFAYNIKTKPLKLFWKFYVKKQGFREGMHGFIFSVLFAWVHFIKWAKYWEMAHGKEQ